MKKVIVVVVAFLIAVCTFILGYSAKKSDKCEVDPEYKQANEKANLIKQNIGKELYSKYFTYVDGLKLFDSDKEEVAKAKIALVIKNLAPNIAIDQESSEGALAFDLKMSSVKLLYKEMFNEEYTSTEEINARGVLGEYALHCSVEGESVFCSYYLEDGGIVAYENVPKYLYYIEKDNKVSIYISLSVDNIYEVVFEKNNDSYYLSSYSKV